MIENLKLKKYENEVESFLYEDEYKLYEDEYNQLKQKKFYKLNRGYVALNDIEKAKETIINAYKIMNMSIEEEIDDIELLIEEFDILIYPLFILE